ncbi:anthranilate phosphoribosyltransferase [Candidatus Omnitrophota bacterium]
MIKDAIKRVVGGNDLAPKEMEKAFSEIMNGMAEPSQISAFITALSIKGESIGEITAAAKVMRKFASTIKVQTRLNEPVLDTCGTGGSGKDTINVSTAAAFVVSGCGVKVAKHGNRAASSRCGSADLLESLGVKIDLPPKRVESCIKNIDIGFMFAPLFHGAMKYAVPVRRSIGICTIFNILGPLSNPANANCQVLGVFRKDFTPLMAGVLKNLGVKRAFVVHGCDGLDEISIAGPTQVTELRDRSIRTYNVTPQKFGLKRAALKDISGGGPKANAAKILSILKGKKGPMRDVVLLNAAFGLVAAGRVKTVKDGIRLARQSIDTGAGLAKLEELKIYTNVK